MDLSQKPHLTAKNSKYLKADDMPEGFSATVTIKGVDVDVFGDDEQEKLILDVGKEKHLVLNKTNTQNCMGAFGPETENWQGKEIFLTTLLYPKFGTRGFVVNPFSKNDEFGDDIPW